MARVMSCGRSTGRCLGMEKAQRQQPEATPTEPGAQMRDLWK